MKNKIKTVIEQLEKAWADDLPKTKVEIFNKAKTEFILSHDHQNLCALLSFCINLSLDTVVYDAAKEAIEMASHEGNKTMTAIYHLIAGKASRNYYSKHEFNQALADPAYLASIRMDDFKWLAKGPDSRIFGNDLLSFIGIEARRYDVMYDYYKTTDNRMAACYSRIHMIIDDVFLQKEKYAALMEVIREYGDLPVVCEAVKYISENDLLPKPEGSGLEVENEYAERKYKFIKPFVKRFADDEHTKELEWILKKLVSPSFKTNTDKVAVPGKRIILPLQYRNINSLTVSIYKTRMTGRDDDNITHAMRDLITSSAPVFTKTCRFENDKPYITEESQMDIEGLQAGIYLMELKSNHGYTVDQILHVSNIIAIAEFLPYKRIRIVVVDNMTGHPIPYAKVDLLDWKSHVIETLSCNKNGEGIHFYRKNSEAPNRIFPYVEASSGGWRQQLLHCQVPKRKADLYCPKESISSWKAYSYDEERSEEVIEIITDRAIYRPGQTVHAAIVAYVVDKDKNVKCVPKKDVKMELLRYYGKCIDRCIVKTDNMGVAHCDFTLPEDAESGSYSLKCEKHDKDIRVEEYKRPTFEVKWDDYTKPYKAGDTIILEGVACSYAGVPVADAVVNYHVKRAEAWWWRFMSRYWEVEGSYGRYGESRYHQGRTKTDDKGRFRVEVPMLLGDEGSKGMFRPLFMNIIAEADVVDTTGEMQSARMSLPLSNREYFMHIQIETQMERSCKPSFVAVIKNALGQDLDKQVTYWLDDSATPATASSNHPVSLEGVGVGKHSLRVKYEDEEQTHEFLIFDKDGMKVPYETELWSYQSADVFPENGGEVILQVGCSEEDTCLVYNVFSGNQLLEKGIEYAASGMVNKRFSYQKKYGNGIVVSYAWVKNKKMQTRNFTIKKPIPKRELKLSWKTFRDRVVPGSKETWVLTVKDKDGRNVTANVIATLYDKSLDQLEPNSWFGFGPVLRWNVPSVEWDYDKIGTLSYHFIKNMKRVEVPFRFSGFKYNGKDMYERSLRFSRGPMYSLSFENSARMAKVDEELMYDCEPSSPMAMCCDSIKQTGSGELLEEKLKDNLEVEEQPVQEIKLRSDMSETAFFMPMLRTDKNGEVNIEFVLPDSLTTWKFQAIAHTQDLHHALFEDETVARKLVMVKPNMPRFVRVGDDTIISAKVTNVSGKHISGKVVFELLDASDEKVVFSDSKPFSLDDDASVATSFQFTPDEEMEEYVCRVYAMGDGFSDGEQHPLRVLPDKTEVTVTNIISQDGAGTETIDTARLLPDGSTRRRLSMQYTNKPLWLAIKALPAMTDEDSDNAISVSVSLFCNLLTAHLQTHAKEFGTDVGVDSRRLDRSTDKLVGKLKKLQGYGGGFKWYKDMPESLYMTTEILMHLCRLQLFVGEMDVLKDIINRAFRFCDAEMCDCVREMKEREKKGAKVYMPTFTMLQHMYNCAIARHVLDEEAKMAYEYLVPLLMKDIHWQTIREKAMSAVILEYSGRHERAQVYAESLRQYTKCDAERGRTFDTPRATYSWCSYKIPTHVAGMEALHMLCPEDRVTFREMQKWLLQEKRTQAWETPIDSVNAVHSLLIDSEEVLSDNRPAVFYVDGKPLDVSGQGDEGYVEADLPATTKELSVKKVSKGLSWGAVFARFLQQMSDVEASGSGMTIKREIITDKKELHVGDRIRVRLTYTCDRNFDFVTIIDSKAACMEPVNQLSWSDSFKYVAPRDTEIRYSYYGLAQGTYSMETEYYLDRPGVYEIGVATIVCSYAPEYRAVCPSEKLIVKDLKEMEE